MTVCLFIPTPTVSKTDIIAEQVLLKKKYKAMENLSPIDYLVKSLASLPGLGHRSARRIALHLLSDREGKMLPLAKTLENVAQRIMKCEICGNLDISSPCSICCNENRDSASICVVASVADLWAIDRTGYYKGHFHILGGLLSALDGISPSELNIENLTKRINDGNIKELIIALSATVEGQSTAHYLHELYEKNKNLKITKPSNGLPIGGELDYLDDGTIITALSSRS